MKRSVGRTGATRTPLMRTKGWGVWCVASRPVVRCRGGAGSGGFRCRSCQNDVWVSTVAAAISRARSMPPRSAAAPELAIAATAAPRTRSTSRSSAPSPPSSRTENSGGAREGGQSQQALARCTRDEDRQAEARERQGRLSPSETVANLLAWLRTPFDFSRLKTAPTDLTFSRAHRSRGDGCQCWRRSFLMSRRALRPDAWGQRNYQQQVQEGKRRSRPPRRSSSARKPNGLRRAEQNARIRR